MSCVFEARHALLCAVHPHRKCFADSRTVLHCNINLCPSYYKPEKIQIKPNGPKNEASELQSDCSVNKKKIDTCIVKNLAQIPILPFSFKVWYVFCVVGKLVENLLHPFMYRMVSMCNQHYQWKIPTILLALTSQEWR